MQELRLLLISLATVLLSSILLFIYFKTRISKVEEKLEIMFNLIQSHAQEKQLSAQQFMPYDNNEVNNEENKRVNLIDVSDNDDDEEDESDSNDSDTDSDDDNDLVIDNNSLVEEDNIKKIELTMDNKDVLFDDTLNEENLSHLEDLQDQIIVQKEDGNDNDNDDNNNNDDDDDDDGNEDDNDENENDEEEEVQETVDLSKLRVVELRKLCSDMGKSGYKSLKKQELIALLQN